MDSWHLGSLNAGQAAQVARTCPPKGGTGTKVTEQGGCTDVWRGSQGPGTIKEVKRPMIPRGVDRSTDQGSVKNLRSATTDSHAGVQGVWVQHS